MKKNGLGILRRLEENRKLLLTMKLTLILLMVCFMQVSATVYSQSTKFTFDVKNKRVEDVLREIENKSDFRFFYQREQVNVERKINLNVTDRTVEEILRQLFSGQDVTFDVKADNLIMIKTQNSLGNNLGSLAQQQQRTVNGKVTDMRNQPLPGVTVVLKGTAQGTVTNTKGEFTMTKLPPDAVLIFSFVGMTTQELLVADKTVIDVVMEDATIGLEEVIAIGYGVQKKKLNTGATIQVKGELISKQATISPMTALQGQTPGVSIIKSSGEPGAGFKVNIRGMGTMGNSQPLYVIDGVPGGNIDYLSPSDIESVDILKDAASAAIYGSRAANGVILVTTKRGENAKSKANISYDGYYGWQNLYKKLPVANAQEYAMLLSEARINSGQTPLDFAGLVPDWDKIQSGEWKGTDWIDELTGSNVPTQNHSLSIYGNTETSNYSLGLSYTSQDGIFGNPVASHYNRYNFRINSDYSVIKSASKDFDILKVGESLRYSFSEQGGIGTGNQYWNDVFSATVTSPFLPLYDKNGDYHYAIPWNLQEANPIASMVYQRGQTQNKNHNLNVNAYVEIQPIRDLKFKSSFGYNMSGGTYRQYTPIYSLSSTVFRSEDLVAQSMNVGLGWTFENTLAYNFVINDIHSISLLAGMSAEKWGLGESLNGSNVNSLFTDFDHAFLDNTPIVNSEGKTSLGGSPWGEGGINSYFGRVSYNYKEKYMATVIMRADASSNFSADNRWGYFPSVSAGWVITEENFMKNKIGILDFLKLRGSWGQNGNQAIDPFQYLATISFSDVNYFFGGDKSVVSTGGYPDILPNPDVTWEVSDQTNIGLDARLLDGRMSVTFDWYNKKTNDWLVKPDNLAIFGTGAPYINGGDVSNKGIEFALGWNDKIGDFTYNVVANFSHNKNEVTYIANTEGIIYGPNDVLGQGTEELYRAQVGYPIGYFRGYKTAGVFQNEEEVNNYKNSQGEIILPSAVPGDLKFVDTNDDGLITDDDKVMIGDPNPDYNIGLNISLGYRGFDFSMMGYGSFGQQIAKSWRRWNDQPQNNFTTDIFGRWHGEGSSNKLPRLTYGSNPNWQYVSDIFIEDGDYFRISNITIGYDVKRILKDKLPLSQARVYFTVQNLYTFTNYSGMDPEIGTSSTDDNWAKGIDIGFYPSPRTVLVGVSLKF